MVTSALQQAAINTENLLRNQATVRQQAPRANPSQSQPENYVGPTHKSTAFTEMAHSDGFQQCNVPPLRKQTEYNDDLSSARYVKRKVIWPGFQKRGLRHALQDPLDYADRALRATRAEVPLSMDIPIRAIYPHH